MVDPLGGSYYVEALTQSLANEAWTLIEEVEQLGGMTKAVESGMPKLRIEEAAARRQARVDRGDETIVGVNKYRLATEAPIEVRDIDNTDVRRQQLERLARVKAERDPQRVEQALEALRNGAAGDGNLLELSIEASRARATVGEISDAMESVFGRHRAVIRSISGVYGGAYEDDEEFARIRKEVDEFAKEEGRRPRILVAKLGQDGHDRGAKVIATAFADLGFDVDIGPLFQTPEEAANDAIENDVHVVGVSSQAAGHKTLVPQLIEALRAQGARDVVVVVGGVIPANDYQFLYDAGVQRDLRSRQQHLPRRVGDPGVGAGAPRRRCRRRLTSRARSATATGARWPARSRWSSPRAPITATTRSRCSTRSSPRRATRSASASAARRARASRRSSRRSAPISSTPVIASRCSRSTRRACAAAARSSATRPAWSSSPAGPRRTSGRRRRAARWAASPAGRARRCSCARPRASTSCSWRPSASASRRSRSRAWSTCSCCCSARARATSCRA